MNTTAILRTKPTTRRAPRVTTHVSDGPSIHHRFIGMGSVCSLQRSGGSHTRELTNRARSTVEVWRGEDVSHCPITHAHSADPRYSWGAIFLYVYTGQITFGAIGLRGVSSETKEAHDDHSLENTGIGVPPPDAAAVEPCSPKSIYRLAEKVRPQYSRAMLSPIALSLRLA